jgi:hypothetical protein
MLTLEFALVSDDAGLLRNPEYLKKKYGSFDTGPYNAAVTNGIDPVCSVGGRA